MDAVRMRKERADALFLLSAIFCFWVALVRFLIPYYLYHERVLYAEKSTP